MDELCEGDCLLGTGILTLDGHRYFQSRQSKENDELCDGDSLLGTGILTHLMGTGTCSPGRARKAAFLEQKGNPEGSRSQRRYQWFLY